MRKTPSTITYWPKYGDCACGGSFSGQKQRRFSSRLNKQRLAVKRPASRGEGIGWELAGRIALAIASDESKRVHPQSHAWRPYPNSVLEAAWADAIMFLFKCEGHRRREAASEEKIEECGSGARGHYYHLLKGVRFGRLGFTHYKWSRQWLGSPSLPRAS